MKGFTHAGSTDTKTDVPVSKCPVHTRVKHCPMCGSSNIESTHITSNVRMTLALGKGKGFRCRVCGRSFSLTGFIVKKRRVMIQSEMIKLTLNR